MKPSRCHECGHRRKRVMTPTSKKGAPARQHKKSCDCECHRKEQQ